MALNRRQLPFNSVSYLLVANRSQADVYAFTDPAKGLIKKQTLEFPEGRDHDIAFTKDRPGRAFDSNPTGPRHRHAMSKEQDIDEQLMARFARQIQDFIEKQRSLGQFDHLIVAADPKFLGVLQKGFSPQTQKLILDSIPKDIVREPIRPLQDRITKLFEEKNLWPTIMESRS